MNPKYCVKIKIRIQEQHVITIRIALFCFMNLYILLPNFDKMQNDFEKV